jgi:putative colanic acid biosynthesis acetyltransferase WcaF
MKKTDLSKYKKIDYSSGNFFSRLSWYFVNGVLFKSNLFPLNTLKVFLLRLFGASVGKGVVVKPCVNIKYPWNLQIGNYVWLGENVWIDNLDKVTILDHSCISQGATLLCGNHDYFSVSFDLITKPIILEQGSWIGVNSTVCPGVNIGSHAVLSAGSVATKDLKPYAIYQGNPACKVRKRIIS